MYERDKWDRIRYSSDLHPNQGQKYTEEDKQYLIDWYDIVGAEEMSFALGRTEGSILQYVIQLRKAGKMSPTNYKPGQNKHRRLSSKRKLHIKGEELKWIK